MIKKYLFILFFIVQFIVPLNGSTITSFLELVLANDGVLIDGKKSVTVQLLSPQNSVRWQETHNVQFFKGRASFEIGHVTEFKTHWFYDEGVQLIIKVDNDQISLPMKSIPFSLFSHAADIVNAIHMEGVFHTNLITERIGINITNPTPSVRLEVGGAMRVGDHSTIDELGTIRWRNFRLEGRHNEVWKYLDVSPADGYESKWTNNQSNTIPAFYVKDTNVRIATKQNLATLTVGGDVYVDNDVIVDGTLTTSGQLTLPNNYGVSKNGELTIRSITLNATNYINVHDGLKVSGKLIGKGHGITNVSAGSLKADAIQNNEIEDLAITHQKIAANAVGNTALNKGMIRKSHLVSTFNLTNDYFKPLIVTDNEIQRESIVSANLANDFELTIYLFKDGAIVSRNIGAQNLDYTKIKDRTLIANDFSSSMIDRHGIIKDDVIVTDHLKDNDILASDFQSGALSFSHLNAIIPMTKGGTNQTSYSPVGGLLVVSSNQIISEPKIVLNASGLGINNASPQRGLDIINQSGKNAVKIVSSAGKASGLVIQNDIGRWLMGVSATGNFEIVDALKSRRMITMSKANGHMGIRQEPGNQKLSINGGVLLGDTALTNLKPGTMFYSKATNKFKLVLPSGITQLEFDGSNHQMKGFFFVSNLNNQSDRSRVLLAENSAIYGQNHLISGLKQSVLKGGHHQINSVSFSKIKGESVHARQISDAIINCDYGGVSYAFSSYLVGNRCQYHQVKYTQLYGNDNIVEFTESSDLHGNDSYLNHVASSAVHGDVNQLSFVKDTQILGDSNYIDNTQSTVLHGDQHFVSQVGDSVILGASHFLHQSNQVVINGYDHHVEFSDQATVVGNAHTIIQGSGVYYGTQNTHVGTGRPVVFGQNNYLFGHQNQTLSGKNVISIGTNNDHDIRDVDDRIVFHAPGGFEVLQNDYIVANLPPHAGSWSTLSDQTIKTNIQLLNADEILKKVLRLNILEWRYKGQHYVQHIGPMAQDFHRAFGLGRSSKYIQSVDMDGVILGAIKGLGNYYNNIVEENDSFKLEKSNIVTRSDVLMADWKTVQASIDSLAKKDKSLNVRFAQMHRKENDQLNEIEALNNELGRLRQTLEASQ